MKTGINRKPVVAVNFNDNTFAITAQVRDALKQITQRREANQFLQRVFACGNREEFERLVRDTVEVRDVTGF